MTNPLMQRARRERNELGYITALTRRQLTLRGFTAIQIEQYLNIPRST